MRPVKVQTGPLRSLPAVPPTPIIREQPDPTPARPNATRLLGHLLCLMVVIGASVFGGLDWADGHNGRVFFEGTIAALAVVSAARLAKGRQ